MTRSKWAQDLREASYKNKKFFVDVMTRTGGRSIINHEFADREEPFAEDMGRNGQGFPITAHVIGDDYFSLRDDLIRVLEKKGVGTLIHPTYGALEVVNGPYKVVETMTDEGRLARFTIQFFEAGSFRFPSEIGDINTDLFDAIGEGIDTYKDAMDAALSIAALPGQAVEFARAAVGLAADAMAFALAPFDALADIGADLAFSIRNLKADVDDLLAAPGDLADRLNDSMDLLVEAVEGKEDRVKSLDSLLNFGDEFVAQTENTPTNIQINDNNSAIKEFMQNTAITLIAQEVVDVPFVSVVDAQNERDRIVDFISEKLESIEVPLSDDQFQAMQDIKANLTIALPNEQADLPDVIEVIPRETTPSLVLTYNIFQDPRREEDIIERNKIKNPAFIPGGVPLEVVG